MVAEEEEKEAEKVEDAEEAEKEAGAPALDSHLTRSTLGKVPLPSASLPSAQLALGRNLLKRTGCIS